MEPTEVLYLIVEASIALAGFAGVVNALSSRSVDAPTAMILRLRLVNLLATSFSALFLSLLALGLHAIAFEPSQIWRIVSAAGLVPMTFFPIWSVRQVLNAVGYEGMRRSIPIYFVNVPVLLVCLLQLWNAIWGGLFWPFFVLVVALFAIGSWSFMHLVLAKED